MSRRVADPSQQLCGCFYQVSFKLRYLPQVELHSYTTLLRTTFETTLRQTFSNDSQDSIKECAYTFPLFEGISIVDFKCHIGNRVLLGTVEENRRAKATYDKALARGETAALLGQLPESSDCFNTSLSNIPANGKVQVEITYVGELKHDAEIDGIRWTLPTSIAPRYGKKPYIPATGAQNEGGITIVVDVDVGNQSCIQTLQSPSHPIAVRMGTTSAFPDEAPVTHKASATLALGSAQLDDDFVLIISNKDNGKPTALLETHSTLANQRAPSHPEIIFVADRSGSMHSEIPTLIAALKVFLRSLPLGVKFNICSFGSKHSLLWPKSKAYHRDSLDEAMAYVQGFEANLGGTETYGALQGAIESRFGDIDCEILLLTDGAVWNQDAVFQYLTQIVGTSIRVFTLGIGSGVSSALIEGVARAGKGFAQMVGNGEKLDKKLVRMLKGALSPHISDYSMEVRYQNSRASDDDMGWEVIEKVADFLKVIKTNEKALQSGENRKTISLYDTTVEAEEKDTGAITEVGHSSDKHLPTTVYLLMSPETVQKDPKSVILRGTSSHGPLELEIEVQKSSTTGKKIHQLAARKAMLELEEGRGWLHHVRSDDETLLKARHASCFDDIVQREAVRLGVQFHVGGRYCSFIAFNESNERLECKGKKKQHASETQKQGSINPNRTGGRPSGAYFCSFGSPAESAKESVDENEDDGYGCLYDSPESKPSNSLQRKELRELSATNESHTIAMHRGGGGVRGGRGGGSRGGYEAVREAGSPPNPWSMASTKSMASTDQMFGAASYSRSADSPPPMPKSEKVHAIINMQDFEGYWEPSDELFDVMDLDEAIESTMTLQEATLLVVVFFERVLMAEKDVWELVVEKAWTWLQSTGIGQDAMDKILAKAREVVDSEYE